MTDDGRGPATNPPQAGRLPAAPAAESAEARVETGVGNNPGLQLHTNPDQAQIRSDNMVAKVLSKVGDIAVLPQVVCQVVEATGTEDASVKRLEQTIVVDPGLSAMILTQANSAYYALPKKVTSIREAVMFLGFKGVRQIAMAVGVFDLFLGKTDGDSLRRRTWWRRSLETAVVCRGMAEYVQDVNPDEAYTCGLLHLIGKTILDRFDHEQYHRVQQVVDQGAPDVLAERAVFSCDHITISTAAAEMWGFPSVLVQGLNYFNPASDPTPENALRAMTALGVRVVRLNSLGKDLSDSDIESVPTWILDALVLTDNKVKLLVRAGLDALEASASFAM